MKVGRGLVVLVFLAAAAAAFNSTNSTECDNLWTDFQNLNESYNNLSAEYNNLSAEHNNTLFDHDALILTAFCTEETVDYSICLDSLRACYKTSNSEADLESCEETYDLCDNEMDDFGDCISDHTDDDVCDLPDIFRVYQSCMDDVDDCLKTADDSEEINDCFDDYDDCDDEKDDLEDCMDDFQLENVSCTTTQQSFESELNTCQGSLSTCTTEKNHCNSEKNAKAEIIDAKETTIQTILTDKEAYKLKADNCDNLINAVNVKLSAKEDIVNEKKTEISNLQIDLNKLRSENTELKSKYDYTCRYPANRKIAYYDSYLKLSDFEKRCLKGIMREKKVTFITVGKDADNKYSLPRLCSIGTQPINIDPNRQMRMIYKMVDLGFIEATNCPQKVDEDLTGDTQKMSALAQCRIKPKDLDYGCIIEWDEDIKRSSGDEWTGVFEGLFLAVLVIGFYLLLRMFYDRRIRLGEKG